MARVLPKHRFRPVALVGYLPSCSETQEVGLLLEEADGSKTRLRLSWGCAMGLLRQLEEDQREAKCGCQSFNSVEREVLEGGSLAVKAAQYGLLHADSVEVRVRPGALPLEPLATAVVAEVGGQEAIPGGMKRRFGVLKATLVVRKAQLKLLVLRLQIFVLTLQGLVPGLSKPKLLAKQRRTAVLVDQLLQKFEWSHGFVVAIKKKSTMAADGGVPWM